MTTEESNAVIENISNALSEHCPLVFADAASLTIVANKVEKYTKELGRVPTIQDVIRWGSQIEADLRRKADAVPPEMVRYDAAIREATPSAYDDEESMADVRQKVSAFRAQHNNFPSELQVITDFCAPHESRLLRDKHGSEIAARKKTRLDYLSGPTREEVVKELRERQTPAPVRKTYVPEDLSQNEIDRLPDEELKRRLFGVESLGLNKESSKLNVEKPANELDEYHRKRILNYRGNDPVMRGLKRQLLDGSEQRDIEYRRRVVESGENERRKVQEELRKAGKR